MNNLDIIGDIHGQADELKLLLSKMGYSDSGGIYSHPERKVMFLGDFIDRGNKNHDVITIARNMVESGNAHAIMGNHEFNALAFHEPHPDGDYYRPRTNKNIKQHLAFLNEYLGDELKPHDLEETLSWFLSLPVYIEIDGARFIHACWHPLSLSVVQLQLDTNNCISKEFLWKAATKGTPEYEAIEILLKGIEARLPKGHSFLDKDKHERFETRIKWWQPGVKTFQNASLVPPATIEQLPDEPIPSELNIEYSGNDKPVFFGHYWMSGEPDVLQPNIACLDFSVAKPGGKLCAYRWSGEQVLDAANIVAVDRLD